ncbi:MAG TPA: 30S ribosomal protein S20 [candidate division Zixibacteria bacterium]|nr:30S ribosomal protein S20 [candidate division Zixibacteria bacterium]
MPRHKSAKKALRKSEKLREHNRALKTRLKTVFKTALTETNATKKAEQIKKAFSLIDKAAKRKLIPKNRAARLKSRLSRSKAA